MFKKIFSASRVESLIGDSSKARKILNWKPKHNIHSLIDDMIKHEVSLLNINKNSKIFIAGHHGMVGLLF